jgi:hypothetical protein
MQNVYLEGLGIEIKLPDRVRLEVFREERDVTTAVQRLERLYKPGTRELRQAMSGCYLSLACPNGIEHDYILTSPSERGLPEVLVLAHEETHFLDERGMLQELERKIQGVGLPLKLDWLGKEEDLKEVLAELGGLLGLYLRGGFIGSEPVEIQRTNGTNEAIDIFGEALARYKGINLGVKIK